MGFYLDLNPKTPEGNWFVENRPPAVYWALYAIAVFALLCMGLAAHQVLGGLVLEASWFDWGLIIGVALVVVIFLVVGFKMIALRKFIDFKGQELRLGYYIFGYSAFSKSFTRDRIADIVLVNQKPAPNLAPQFHDDPQYFIRGHWRLILETQKHGKYVLDKHVEREALLPLFTALKAWWRPSAD